MPAEIPDGAVLVARAIVNSSLWTMRPEDCKVAITCIALCNKTEKKWFDGEREISIPRGSFVRSWGNFVKSCALPLQVVRTSVDHLKTTDFLTRSSTRHYTLFTIHKYEHYQDLTKYSDSVMFKTNTEPNTSLTTNNNRYKNGSSFSGKNGGGTAGGVVVVRNGKPDQVLEKINPRIALDLLLELRMAERTARALAGSKPVGQVLNVAQLAKLQKSPAGWARSALENDWAVPEAQELERAKVLGKISAQAEKVNAFFMTRTGVGGVKMSLPTRAPGEDDRSWMRRVTDELKRRKEGALAAGRKEKKAAGVGHLRAPEKDPPG